MIAESRRQKWVWKSLMVLIAFAYLYFVPYFQRLNNPNENSRIYQVRSAVEQHTFAIDSQLKQFGWVNDLAVRQGRHYQCKAPGPIFLAIPVYAVLQPIEKAAGHDKAPWFDVLYAIRLFVVLLPSLSFIYLFREFMRRKVVDDSSVANGLAIVLATDTLYFSYSLIFVNHTLSAIAAFGALMALYTAGHGRAPVGSWRRRALFFVGGMLLAGSTSLDYATFPISVALLVYGLRLSYKDKRLWLPMLAGASVPSMLVAYYHQVCWGSPFRVGQAFLENPVFAGYASKGIFGFGQATSESVIGVLVSTSKGLLFFSPVMALGLVSLVVAGIVSRRRVEAVLSFGVVLWMLLYNVSLVNWDGGWTVGPRYVTVISPFVVFAMGLFWDELGRRGRRWYSMMLGVLAVPAMMATVLTSVFFPHLQPEYHGPLREFVWPLWRDGYTPWSWGRALFGLSGHADQVPYLVVVGLLLGYVIVTFGWTTWRRGGSKPLVAMLSSLLVVVGAAVIVVGQMSPTTENDEVVRRGRAWVLNRVWSPPRTTPPRTPPRSRHGK